MPLTRLANAIIDGVADAPAAVAAEIEKYSAPISCFIGRAPRKELCERQALHWDPILTWARDALGARFQTGEGITTSPNPLAALEAARAAIPADPWRLGAVHVVTTLTGRR